MIIADLMIPQIILPKFKKLIQIPLSRVAS